MTTQMQGIQTQSAMNTSLQLQAPETASKPVGCNEIDLSNENQAELSMMSLENTAVKENSQTESSRRSPTELPTERKGVKTQPGKPSRDDQQHQICQRNRGCAQKSVKRTAAAPRQVKPIQVETNAAQQVKQSELHINPPSNRVRKSIEKNRVAQPENHINPTSSGVQKTILQNKVSQPIKKIVANKTANPQKVLRVKEKNEAAKSSPKPILKPAAQIHYIQWHGFESFHESIGWNCSLCENDLAHSPTEEEQETDKFPDVAVLPCGHAFHNVCLQLSTSKLQCSDPPCIICTSFQS